MTEVLVENLAYHRGLTSHLKLDFAVLIGESFLSVLQAKAWN